jgi:hypothetical protein
MELDPLSLEVNNETRSLLIFDCNRNILSIFLRHRSVTFSNNLSVNYGVLLDFIIPNPNTDSYPYGDFHTHTNAITSAISIRVWITDGEVWRQSLRPGGCSQYKVGGRH